MGTPVTAWGDIDGNTFVTARNIGGYSAPFVASANQIAGVSQFNGQPIAQTGSYSYAPIHVPPGQSNYGDKPYQQIGLSSVGTSNFGQPAAVQPKASYYGINMGRSSYAGSNSGATGGSTPAIGQTAQIVPDPQRPSTAGVISTSTSYGSNQSGNASSLTITYDTPESSPELTKCLDNPLFPVGTLTPPPGFYVGLQGGFEYGFLATPEWEADITKIGPNFEPSKRFYQNVDLPDDEGWFRGGCPVGSLQVDEAIINGLDYRLCRGLHLPPGAAYTIGYESSNTVFSGANCSIVACGSATSYSQCLTVTTRYYLHWVYVWTYSSSPKRATPSLYVTITTSQASPYSIFTDRPYSNTAGALEIFVDMVAGYSGTIVAQLTLNTTASVNGRQVTGANGGRTYYGTYEVFPQSPGWNAPFNARVDFDYQNSANLGYAGYVANRFIPSSFGGSSIFSVRQEWVNPVSNFFGVLGDSYVFDINNRVFKPSFGAILGFNQFVHESCTSTYQVNVQSTWDNSQMQQLLLAYGYVRNTAPTYYA